MSGHLDDVLLDPPPEPVGRLDGCGSPIEGGTCGHVGICTTCWAKRNDKHVPTLVRERDHALAALTAIRSTCVAGMNARSKEIVLARVIGIVDGRIAP